ncbi:MAG: class I SAM-dependent methyltransferase [Acidobacteriota bacterium]
MDAWKFYDITHRHHVVCNPSSRDKLEALVGLLRLAPRSRVVDIACGKAELLIRTVESYRADGLGIDLSPFFVDQAKARILDLELDDDIDVKLMNGADFVPDEPRSFDVASCLGASWIWDGHAGTLDALIALTKPNGWVVVGEPYWLQEPPSDYLQAEGLTHDQFGTQLGNIEVGEERGLELVHVLVSNQDDWDRYEGLKWAAAAEHARACPDDPDLAELTDRVALEKSSYLRWGRDTLGWAIYVFRLRA